MKQLRGHVALVTGASEGLGVHIARALAREGMDVAVSARRKEALASVAGELPGLGVRAAAVPADLADFAQIDPLVERTEAALGPIDVLINNAGIEIAAAFSRITCHELTSMVDVNLTAPLLLTHRVVPCMLDRGRGHVVFISSAAGKIGPAYQQPYAATKAGLIGLTQSLRAEYADAPVGFSVICPGFIAGDGMYQRMVERGVKSNRILGETTTEKVAAEVVRAIRHNLPEVVETGTPIRPLLAVNEVAPRFVERTARRLGLHEIFRRSAAARGRV